VKHGSRYANLADVEEVFTIGMNRAVEVLAQKTIRGARGAAAAATPLRMLGEHPEGGPVVIMPGRYGAYVKWGAVNATIPKETPAEALTLDAALELLAARAGAGRKGKAKAPAGARPAARAPAKTGGKTAARKAPEAADEAPDKAPSKPKAAARPKAAAPETGSTAKPRRAKG
jgi:DNA topoisomerase-1